MSSKNDLKAGDEVDVVFCDRESFVGRVQTVEPGAVRIELTLPIGGLFLIVPESWLKTTTDKPTLMLP